MELAALDEVPDPDDEDDTDETDDELVVAEELLPELMELELVVTDAELDDDELFVATALEVEPPTHVSFEQVWPSGQSSVLLHGKEHPETPATMAAKRHATTRAGSIRC